MIMCSSGSVLDTSLWSRCERLENFRSQLFMGLKLPGEGYSTARPFLGIFLSGGSEVNDWRTPTSVLATCLESFPQTCYR